MQAEPALAVASGVLVALVGAGLLAARPRRSGGAFFGAFAVLWGVEIVAFNVGRSTADLALADALFRVGLAVKVPEALLLVHFATTFPHGARGRAWPVAVAAAAALSGAVWLLVEPSAFLAGTVLAADGTARAVYGRGTALALAVPFFASLYVAAALLLRSYRRETDRLVRRELAVVAAAVLLYVAPATAYFLVFYAFGWSAAVATNGALVSGLFLAIFSGGALVVGALVASLAGRVRRGLAPRDRPADVAILVVLVAGSALGALGALPLAWGGDPVETPGVLRIAAGALVAYGVLKHQVFGLDLGLKRVVRVGFPLACAVAAVATGAALARAAVPALAGSGLLVAGLGAGAVAAAVSYPARDRVADRLLPYVADEKDYRRARAVEVYRTALAQAVARGDPADAFLAELRRRLGVDAEMHDVLLKLAVATPAASPAPAADARFHRERMLAEGGAGRAWLATDRVLGRRVVLKELFRPGEALLAEARAAASVQHANVVTVHDVLDQEDRAALVLEYVEGGSLQELLDREGRLPRGRALAVAADVLRGLEALHARGLVHRDVKPANVLLDTEGRAKVADLGLAAAAVDPSAGSTAAFGPAPGTLLFMSPEQAEGRGVDARTDVYAVGALLYLALAGRFYVDFGNHGEFAVRRMIVSEPPRLPIRGEPDAVNAVLAQALAKAPAHRFASAGAMLAAVEAAREPGAGGPA